VDNQAMTRERIQRIPVNNRLTVVIASDGGAALPAPTRLRIDHFLFEAVKQLKGGFLVCREITPNPLRTLTAVVFVTALSQPISQVQDM